MDVWIAFFAHAPLAQLFDDLVMGERAADHVSSSVLGA